jgi:serine/threonine protein phosphatase PrpC
MAIVGQIDASLRTDKGRVRDHNEDFVAFHEPAGPSEEDENGWLFIVADGVGGADAGEVASQYATEQTIAHYLAGRETADWGQRLLQAMQAANSDLRQLVAEQVGNNRMATTMVATVLHDSTATIANVGDSRGYHWRDGRLRQITKDQSLVARLLEEGAITEEEALNHPRKNVILHSLGSEKKAHIDLYDVGLMPGEKLVLCSDGLTRHVADSEIAKVISEKEPAEATDILIQLANRRGGEDNISVAVLHIGEHPSPTMDSASPGIKVASGQKTRVRNARNRRTLWIYTAFLCVVQTILIVLIWFLIIA